PEALDAMRRKRSGGDLLITESLKMPPRLWYLGPGDSPNAKSVASYSTKRGTEIARTNVPSSSRKSKALDAPRRDRAAATSTLVSSTTLISMHFRYPDFVCVRLREPINQKLISTARFDLTAPQMLLAFRSIHQPITLGISDHDRCFSFLH